MRIGAAEIALTPAPGLSRAGQGSAWPEDDTCSIDPDRIDRLDHLISAQVFIKF